MKYNLQDIFNGKCNNHYMVLYSIKNLLDGRYYIGQCIDFYDRFVSNKMWSHKIGNQYIDNSIRFHGASNFEVQIIYEDLNQDELNYYESRFIKLMHTWDSDDYWKMHHKRYKQYNQLPGGYDHNRYTELAYLSIRYREEYGDGDSAYMMHSDESYRKSAETRTKLYGSPNACCNTPEARMKADETNRANHDGHLAWNTPEQVKAMMDTQYKNHDGVLAFQTEDSYNWRDVNGVIKSCENILKLGYDELTIDLYCSYKVRSAPSLTRVKDVISNNLNLLDDIFKNFIYNEFLTDH